MLEATTDEPSSLGTISVAGVAKALARSEATVRRLIRTGALPAPVKLNGGPSVFLFDQLVEHINDLADSGRIGDVVGAEEEEVEDGSVP